MNCMKCGREIPVGEVFCEICLGDMAKYPVKPGTVVNLPPRTSPQPVKKQAAQRQQVSAEERIKVLGRRVRALSWSLTLAVALLIGVSALAITMLQEQQDEPLPGQNYSAEGEAKSTDDWYIDRFQDAEKDPEDTTENTEGREQLDGKEQQSN